MNIAIYSPYLDTAGGGEKYMLSIAEILSGEGNRVDVLLDKHLSGMSETLIKNQNEIRHSLNLSNTHFVKAPIGKGSTNFSRLLYIKKYDWLFYNSDGSIFSTSAKNSIVHFQMPFSRNISILERLKLATWKSAIYNSAFTKNIIEQHWPIQGRVVFPPVDTDKIQPLPKKKQILTVGRFQSSTKMKKHEVMIDIFKQMYDRNILNGWSLHLAGGVMAGDEDYINRLKELASALPIYFYPNCDIKELYTLYGESIIYWHAAGFAEEDPIKSEHFGITTVEAMAGGCVPVVINKGGQREIVSSGDNGFLWNTAEDCITLTYRLIQDPVLTKKLSIRAVENSMDYSKKKFENNIKELVYGNNN